MSIPSNPFLTVILRSAVWSASIPVQRCWHFFPELYIIMEAAADDRMDRHHAGPRYHRKTASMELATLLHNLGLKENVSRYEIIMAAVSINLSQVVTSHDLAKPA